MNLPFIKEASPTAETNYTAAVDEVIRIDSDLLIYCDLESPSLEVMIPLFKEKDYTPRGALSISYDLKIDQSLLEFWCVSLTVCYKIFLLSTNKK